MALAGSCGGGSGTGDDGPLCTLDLAVPGFFTYCSEYIGFSEAQCQQNQGTFNGQCAPGYVGYCEVAGRVNPRRTYFYGALVTPSIVNSVCPGGVYRPGTVPGKE